MILPPFFGINSPYDEDFIKEVIFTYLANDTLTYSDPKPIASVAYEAIDILTNKTPRPVSNISFLAIDTISLPLLSSGINLTYNSFDICTYDPPPTVPEITNFTLTDVNDREINFSWSTPYNNRCDITEYILQYSDCFLSKTLAENSDIIISENSDTIIGEHYRDNCNYQEYDRRKILIENHDRLQANTQLFITEQSSGIGVINNLLMQDLVNNQPYIFRIAAVNCVGTGEFGYSDILIPYGPVHEYCDIKLFLQPNSTNDISVSLQDYSCREKDSEEIAGVTVSTESQFGAGSLYFDGVYTALPAPATYSHIRVDHNSGVTLEDWSLYGDFTIELWIRPDNTYANDTIISAYTQYDDNYNSANDNHWKLRRTSNDLEFILNINEDYDEDPYYFSASMTLRADNVDLPTTDFTHIAVSRFDGVARLYVSGILYDTEEFSHNVNISGNIMIIGGNQGSYYDVSDTFGIGRGAITEPYIGYIDDIMISNSARYSKSSIIPDKYQETADCDGCGGYTIAATSVSIGDEFIP